MTLNPGMDIHTDKNPEDENLGLMAGRAKAGAALSSL